MKILFYCLFLFFSLSLNGQETQTEKTESNSKKRSIQKKEKSSNSFSSPFYRPYSTTGGTIGWRVGLRSNSIKHSSKRKERVLFKSEGNDHLTLVDLEAHYFNKSKKSVQILSGEKVKVLKIGARQYKIIYNNQKLYIDRQYYIPSIEESKN